MVRFAAGVRLEETCRLEGVYATIRVGLHNQIARLSSRVKASGLFKLCLAIVSALGYGMVTQYTY